jgi:hypothetical protein
MKKIIIHMNLMQRDSLCFKKSCTNNKKNFPLQIWARIRTLKTISKKKNHKIDPKASELSI